MSNPKTLVDIPTGSNAATASFAESLGSPSELNNAAAGLARTGVGSAVDLVASFVPLGNYLAPMAKKTAMKTSEDFLNSETGKQLASTAFSFIEKAILVISKWLDRPMPAVAEAFQQDSSKIDTGLATVAANIKTRDGKQLMEADELKQAVNLGIKDSITVVGLISPPSPPDVAENIHKNVFKLSYAKLLQQIPEDDRKDPTKVVPLQKEAAKIAGAVSGVYIEKNEGATTSFKSTNMEGTALSYLTAIFPKEGSKGLAQSTENVAFAPPIPKLELLSTESATPQQTAQEAAKNAVQGDAKKVAAADGHAPEAPSTPAPPKAKPTATKKAPASRT
jgi:hypothetical protein